MCVCVYVQVSVRHLDTRSGHTQLISVGLAPAGSAARLLPTPGFPLSCRPSLQITGRLISSDWQPCSHLALQSWRPRVSASRKAMAEVPLWLSLSFSQYPAPADWGWKVPTTALNYELDSAPAIYTTRHRELFPAEMPLAADYWGNISCTATRVVMVRRQSTWRSFCPPSDDWHERRGIDSCWNWPFYHTVVKRVRWFLMRTTSVTFSHLPEAIRARTAIMCIITDTSEIVHSSHIPYYKAILLESN